MYHDNNSAPLAAINIASIASNVCELVQITKYDFNSRAAYIPA
jgi:hypothetical protein